jgi:hypothetical protein
VVDERATTVLESSVSVANALAFLGIALTILLYIDSLFIAKSNLSASGRVRRRRAA